MRPITSLALAVVVLALGPARAHASNPNDLVPPGWWAPVGINVGLSLHERTDKGALVLGVEGSIVHFDGTWVGAYADALYDFGPSSGRLSIGPEAGFSIFGVDLGYVVELDAGEARHGLQGRALITVGFAAIYFRAGRTFGDDGETFGDLGLLLKFPFPVSTHYHPTHLRGGVPPTSADSGMRSQRPSVEVRPGAAVTAAPVTSPPSGPRIAIRVSNEAQTPICQAIFRSTSLTGGPEEDPNRLGPEESIPVGASRSVDVRPGTYDVRLLSCDGAVMAEWSSLPVVVERTLTATSD